MLYQKALASEKKKKKGLFILPMRIMYRKKQSFPLPTHPPLHP